MEEDQESKKKKEKEKFNSEQHIHVLLRILDEFQSSKALSFFSAACSGQQALEASGVFKPAELSGTTAGRIETGSAATKHVHHNLVVFIKKEGVRVGGRGG